MSGDVDSDRCFIFPICGLILIKGILAYGRTKGYFYAYYVTKTLTAMVSDGSMMCLSLAYVVGYLHSQLGAHLSH